jgi:hypothetical protein
VAAVRREPGSVEVALPSREVHDDIGLARKELARQGSPPYQSADDRLDAAARDARPVAAHQRGRGELPIRVRFDARKQRTADEPGGPENAEPHHAPRLSAQARSSGSEPTTTGRPTQASMGTSVGWSPYA